MVFFLFEILDEKFLLNYNKKNLNIENVWKFKYIEKLNDSQNLENKFLNFIKKDNLDKNLSKL
jgi:hypothetical protein